MPELKLSNLLARYRRVLIYLVPRAFTWAGALASAALLNCGLGVAGAIVALGVVAHLIWARLTDPLSDSHLVARALLSIALVETHARRGGPAWLWLVVGGALLAMLMIEPTLSRATEPRVLVRGLPTLRRHWVDQEPDPASVSNLAALALLALGVFAALPVVLPAGLLATLCAGFLLDTWRLARVRRHAAEKAVRAALLEYEPDFCLYYSGAAKGSYQIAMWQPFLERAGAREMLIVRSREFFAARPGPAEWPVIYARSVEALEYLMTPSVKAMFYVNNDARNADGVRFASVRHVHLGHGDSEKPASYSATTAMFDRIFVAGQAAVDRYQRHGVLIPREKFELVGRPQVETIKARTQFQPGSRPPVVLYAPTWRGSIEDSKFGSLVHGERIVRALIDAGASVWFRPHPYDYRDASSRVLMNRVDAILAAGAAGRHRTSAKTRPLSVIDCMNASDALVTDISSLASDYLYSDKPMALVNSAELTNPESSYPLARAARLIPTGPDLAKAVREFVASDTLRDERAELRSYYLGDWPGQEYSGVFVAAVRRMIAEPPDRSGGSG